MRVAIVCDYFYPNLGGTQDMALLLARGLVERGHTVDLYVPGYPRREYERAKLPPGDPELPAGVVVHRLPSMRWLPPLYQVARPSRALCRALAENRPDVVHVQTILTLGFTGVRAARRLKIPVIATNHLALRLHAAYLPGPLLALQMAYVRWLLNQCNYVSAPAAFVFDELGALRAPHGVVTNPIDLSLFAPLLSEARAREREQLGSPTHLIVFAGRLVREKSLDMLLRALPEICRRVPGTLLVLAGHGDQRASLEALRDELHLGDAVRFVGTLDKPKLAQLVGAADLFVSPSASEVQSTSQLQALTCGTPAVAVDVPAEHGKAGVALCARTPESLAEVVCGLLADDVQRAALAAAGRAFAAQCAISAVAAQWEALYGRVGAR